MSRLINMEVSSNSGNRESSIQMEMSIINQPFGGSPMTIETLIVIPIFSYSSPWTNINHGFPHYWSSLTPMTLETPNKKKTLLTMYKWGVPLFQEATFCWSNMVRPPNSLNGLRWYPDQDADMDEHQLSGEVKIHKVRQSARSARPGEFFWGRRATNNKENWSAINYQSINLSIYPSIYPCNMRYVNV